MDIMEKAKNLPAKYPRLVAFVEKSLKRFPFIENYIKSLPSVRKQIDKEYDAIMASLEKDVKPYRGKFDSYPAIPAKGLSRQKVLADMQKMYQREKPRWKKGFVSGAVYHGDEGHIDFLNRVYAINSQTNPLHSDLWPSIGKYEAEVISMTANMLGASHVPPERGPICGSVSSGGTESILLAMKSYRDRGRALYGIKRPEMIAPVTAHAAFDKAAQFFKIKLRKIPIGPDFRADVKAVKRAISGNTVAIVGSAVTFPHGVVDPIEEMSELARENNIGFHTDACLGGFILPWAEKLKYNVPSYDFRLPGVTSMSADTHKYGYAAKGTSVVLYRGNELRQFQYFTTTEWPGGLYFSPTIAGSRPGGLVAAAWAAMISMGEKGYMESAKKILKTAEIVKKGIRSIPELRILNDPLWVISFASDSLDIYRVMDFMTQRHWNLNGLHRPACVHIALTLRHTQPGVAARLIKDLKAAVQFVKTNPSEKGGNAPVYGMAASIPVRSLIGDLLKKFMDLNYKV